MIGRFGIGLNNDIYIQQTTKL